MRSGYGDHEMTAPGSGSLIRAAVCAIVLSAAALPSGCGSSAGSEDGGSAQGSGVEGTVTVGPTCPGPAIVNGEGDCTEPLAVDLQVIDAATGREAAQTSSDSQGHFRVDLAPGSYRIAVVGNSGLAAPVEVTVKPAHYSVADLAVDSGVR